MTFYLSVRDMGITHVKPPANTRTVERAFEHGTSGDARHPAPARRDLAAVLPDRRVVE
jgi:hypothetical protein